MKELITELAKIWVMNGGEPKDFDSDYFIKQAKFIKNFNNPKESGT